ncbi:MAG: flagellar biosynthetic protein FliR [Desulfuromonadaceae bacterium]|nr:flagellar biosynthetic protein FliR [Desulfuromonadaceae bacterium]
MDLPLVSVEIVQRVLICLVRVVALFASMPVFSSGQTPARVKLGLAILVTFLIFPLVDFTLPENTFAPVPLALLVANESLMGIMMGFMSRLVFTAVEFGGTIVGYQMGFAAANVYDPQNQHQVSLMSQFQNVIAILVFLAVDGHHIFIRVLADSYVLAPPGMLDFSGQVVPYIMELSSQMFVLAVRFSAPVLAVLLLSGLVLGLMSRIFPQLNVFMLSFPINIGLSFVILGLTMNIVVTLLGREFTGLADQFHQFFENIRE